VRKQIARVLESVFEQDYVTVAPVKDTGIAEFVGKDLKSAIADWKTHACRRGPIWNLRKPPGCATKSSGWRRSTWFWNRRPEPAPACGQGGTAPPEPMGPGGGGYDPSKRRGRSGMRRRGP